MRERKIDSYLDWDNASGRPDKLRGRTFPGHKEAKLPTPKVITIGMDFWGQKDQFKDQFDYLNFAAIATVCQYVLDCTKARGYKEVFFSRDGLADYPYTRKVATGVWTVSMTVQECVTRRIKSIVAVSRPAGKGPLTFQALVLGDPFTDLDGDICFEIASAGHPWSLPDDITRLEQKPQLRYLFGNNQLVLTRRSRVPHDGLQSQFAGTVVPPLSILPQPGLNPKNWPPRL